ncbi:hypothetical protein FHT98_2475 [Bosea sp. AK1]|nr:hypothetical protein FHT98_2475 [Bosea sp. AK1]
MHFVKDDRKKIRAEGLRRVPDRGSRAGLCFGAARRPEGCGGVAPVIVPVRYKALLLQEDCH